MNGRKERLVRRFTKRGALVVMERHGGPIGETLCAVARCQCCGQQGISLILRVEDQCVVCVDCIQRAAHLFGPREIDNGTG